MQEPTRSTLRDDTDDADVFIQCPLKDRVVLSAGLQNRHARASVAELLHTQVEGRCRPYGYVRPGSLRVSDIGEGVMDETAMDGSCVFEVQFSADVCNPPVGSHVRCRVENVNAFGILASNLSECRVLEIILPREPDSFSHDIDFDDVRPGAVLTVQIAGKRYSLGQDTITVIGRAVAHDVQVRPEIDGAVTDPEVESATEADDTDVEDADPVDEPEDDEAAAVAIGKVAIEDPEDEREEEEDDDTDGEDDDDDDEAVEAASTTAAAAAVSVPIADDDEDAEDDDEDGDV